MCGTGCTCSKPAGSCCSTPSPASPAAGDPIGLDTKLGIFDRHARQAVAELIEWMQAHPDDLIAVARGRHVTGHLLYEDANFAEWDRPRLRKEIAEEIADAIVYGSRLIHLRAE